MGIGIRKKRTRKHNKIGTNYGKFATQGMQTYFDDCGKRYPQSIVEFSNGNRTKEAFHPTQKPLNLIRYLIRTYGNENDIVFDGYFGSGTTAVACVIEKRQFIGCELKREYYRHAIDRVRDSQRLYTFL